MRKNSKITKCKIFKKKIFSQHKNNSFILQNKGSNTKSSKKDESTAVIEMSHKRKDEKFEIRFENLEEPQFTKMFEDMQNDDNEKKRFTILLEKFKNSTQNQNSLENTNIFN